MQEDSQWDITNYIVLSIILLSIVYADVHAEDLTSSNFIIRNPTIDSGGGWSTSNSFQVFDSTGQSVIDESSASSFSNQSGFGYIHDPQFTLDAPNGFTFDGLSVSINTQNTSGSLNGVTVVNTRGTGVAWSLTATVTNLTRRGTSSMLSGTNNTVTFTGTYTGVIASNTVGRYVVEITTGGSLGTGIFKWTGPDGVTTEGVSTAASVTLNSGITAQFGEAAYSVGDKWLLRVDSMGYTSLTLSPGVVTVNFGDSNVTAGAQGTFTGSGSNSGPRTLMSAQAANGEGSYTQNISWDQEVHPNTLEGEFNGTVTLTLS